ncbi:MAG: PEP/pyruvate-binding domain-containing protein [Syntrophobacteraceae bacterium]
MLKSIEFLKSLMPRRRKPATKNLTDLFRQKYEHFKQLLDSNAEMSKIIADIEEKLQGRYVFGMAYVRSQSARAVFYALRMVQSLNALSANRYLRLVETVEKLNLSIKEELDRRKETEIKDWILPYERLTKEMVDVVGGKNANLGEVRNRVSLPIPEGFAITTNAYEHFLQANDLIDEINLKKMQLAPEDPESVTSVSEDIQRLIITAPVPDELARAILAAYDAMRARILERRGDGFSGHVSLRSSAIGEDSELSFAGQYLSMLNVPRERLVQTYKFIIASLFTPRAISYRLNKGIRDEDIAMSVACLEMVDSVASGVMYSRHPFDAAKDQILINAVWGLGPYAVDGIITPDSFTVSRGEVPTITETRVSPKHARLVSNPEGGLTEAAVPDAEREAPCLSEDQVLELARWAVVLENHYDTPQDTEWALDPAGNLLLLQTRPLKLDCVEEAEQTICVIDTSRYPVLIESAAVASPGIGAGPAYLVQSDDDLAGFPEGAVLIAKHSSPKFVVVMQKAQAIVADSGSVTGHMASLSREFGVPTLLDARQAMKTIPSGTEITVDAFSGKIYEGTVPELISLQVVRRSDMEGTPVLETLKRIATRIVPLRLFDPKSPEFIPENCKSLHDVMRFVHESSYAEMFQISDAVTEGEGHAMKLDAPLPIDLRVIDLGGGIVNARPDARKVKEKQIASAPFRALLKGMLHEELRYMKPRPVELRGFLSVMGEQMFTNVHGTERFGDRSYAIISDKYINFSSRVGYHYGILDAYCGLTMNKNYVSFSFKGGAADDVRRNRRARAIALILKDLGFTVDVQGDRVDAKLQKYEAAVIEEKLDYVGRLLLFTRQMDMLMHNEATIPAIAQAFMEEDYQLERFLARKQEAERDSKTADLA